MMRVPSVILFDGVCNLCSATVLWVIKRDTRSRFRFASLQSDAARRELARTPSGAELGGLPDSLVLIDRDGIHIRSAAAIRIARGLGFPYSLLGLGMLFPRMLRDAAYDLVARNRYRWFGRRDRCMVPSPELAMYFLDTNEGRNMNQGTAAGAAGGTTPTALIPEC